MVELNNPDTSSLRKSCKSLKAHLSLLSFHVSCKVSYVGHPSLNILHLLMSFLPVWLQTDNHSNAAIYEVEHLAVMSCYQHLMVDIFIWKLPSSLHSLELWIYYFSIWSCKTFIESDIDGPCPGFRSGQITFHLSSLICNISSCSVSCQALLCTFSPALRWVFTHLNFKGIY